MTKRETQEDETLFEVLGGIIELLEEVSNMEPKTIWDSPYKNSKEEISDMEANKNSKEMMLMLRGIKNLEARFKKETEWNPQITMDMEKYLQLKGIHRVKDFQNYRDISEEKGITPLLELSTYTYEELNEIVDMSIVTKGIYYSGYFVDDEDFYSPEEFWEYRVVGNQFNLNPTDFMLRVLDEGHRLVFTDEFCKNLIWELIKLEFIIETDILAEIEGISIEEAIDIYNDNLVNVIEGQHFGSNKTYSWRDNLQVKEGDIVLASTHCGNKLVKTINTYKVGKLFAYDLKETKKIIKEEEL